MAGLPERQNGQNTWQIMRRMLDIALDALAPAEGTPGRPSDPLGPPTMPPNPEWQWLSPLERDILAALADDKYHKAAAIAVALKVAPDGKLYTLLNNLVERKVLQAYRKGYRINRGRPESEGAEDVETADEA
jgi:hypothetical protein